MMCITNLRSVTESAIGCSCNLEGVDVFVEDGAVNSQLDLGHKDM